VIKCTIKVTPNAKKNSIEGFQDGLLKVKIKAVPDKGKANEALIAFLAESFHLAKSQIRIISGHTSRLKRLEIDTDIDINFLIHKKSPSN
jgi:uncharacterized protein (TIGR00251 family)